MPPRVLIPKPGRKIAACVFAKPPVPGYAKTRLIPLLGPDGAAEVAAAMLCDVWRTIGSCTEVTPVLATVAGGTYPIPVPRGRVWRQGEGDLGARIERILARALKHAPAALAIGADCPLLTRLHISEALAGLGTHDAVVGPSRDGGFYLLGVRRCPPGLLGNLPWSTSETASSTIARLRKVGFRVLEIAPLLDVDTPADLDVLAHVLQHDPSAAPATRQWLLRYGASRAVSC